MQLGVTNRRMSKKLGGNTKNKDWPTPMAAKLDDK